MYLQTLLGLRKGPVQVKRDKSIGYQRADRLASKQVGSVARMFRQLQECGEDVQHRPSKRGTGHWIGVEIECYYPSTKSCSDECDHDNDECFGRWDIDEDDARFKVRERLIEAGVVRASVKDDGSLESEDGIPVEVTLLFNTEDGFGQLQKLCGVLNDLGMFVNDKCGLHVHLDARHLKPRRVKLLGQRLGRALPVLKYIVDPSRHDNRYCQMQTGPFDRNHDNRYYAVNMQAWFRYKTIEIRMHGGSTNAKKIQHWIELLRFVAGSRVPKQFTTFQDLIDLGTPPHLVEYADKRITRLNPGAWPKLMQDKAPKAVVVPQDRVYIGPKVRVDGEVIQWFREFDSGMTTNIENAYLFTRAEAETICALDARAKIFTISEARELI